MNKLSMKTSMFPIPGTTYQLPAEMEKFLTSMNRELIGAENHFNRYFSDTPLNSSNYPPYNIEKLEDDYYRITIAIAGFAKENVKITVENSLLTINGSQGWEDQLDEENDKQFLYKGIANRDFKLRFNLAEHVTVLPDEAKFENGLLSLDLERIIPEEMKPQTINIK